MQRVASWVGRHKLAVRYVLYVLTVVVSYNLAVHMVHGPGSVPLARIANYKGKVTLTTSTVTETVPVPYTETTVEDPTFQPGYREVTTPGQDGSKTITYQVTYMNGVETNRKVVQESMSLAPVTEITNVGPYIDGPDTLGPVVEDTTPAYTPPPTCQDDGTGC